MENRAASAAVLVVVLLVLALGVSPALAQSSSSSTVPWSNYFGGNGGPTTFTPTMFGDLIGHRQFGGLAVFRGGFKIAENESPRPLDRLYVNYNFYSNVSKVADVHRETLGFEKVLFNGQASVGLRLPFFQVHGNRVVGDTNSVDDLTLVLKYAWLHDPVAALSTGLAVTMPSGSEPNRFIARNGTVKELHPALFQPFVGYLWSHRDLYAHGFGSLMVPSDSSDVIVGFLDFGIGYWIFRGGGVLTGIVPTFEAHVNLPLNHRSDSDVPSFRRSVDLVGGVHFVLRDRVSIGLAVGAPVTSPKLFDVEAIANINFRF
jgi:hypothetical protein